MCIADALSSHPNLLGTPSSDSFLLQTPVDPSLAIALLSLWAGSRQSANNLMPIGVVYSQVMDGVDEWESHFQIGITWKPVPMGLSQSLTVVTCVQMYLWASPSPSPHSCSITSGLKSDYSKLLVFTSWCSNLGRHKIYQPYS